MVAFWGRGQNENSKITWRKMEIMLLLPLVTKQRRFYQVISVKGLLREQVVSRDHND